MVGPGVKEVSIYFSIALVLSILAAWLCYRWGKRNLNSIESQRVILLQKQPPASEQELNALEDHPLQIYGLHLLAAHPRIVGSVLVATNIVFFAGFLRLFLVVFFDCPFSDWAKEPNTWILREFSAAGLREYVFAILGVMAGIIATLVVEKTSSSRTASIASTTSKIETTSANIEATSKHIHSQVSELRHVLGVRPIKDLHELMTAIEEVFDLAAQRTSNWLWIMNPTASYGYFNTFDADNILEAAGLPVGETFKDRPTKMSKLKQSQFEKCQDGLRKRHTDVKEKLSLAIAQIREAPESGGTQIVDKFGGVEFRRVEYATLSASCEALEDGSCGTGATAAFSFYQREFVLPAITGKETVSEADKARVAILDVEKYWAEIQKWTPSVEKEKVFFVPIRKLQRLDAADADFEYDDQATVLDWLLTHLNNKQKRDIDDWEAALPSVREMKHVPMQMFMSIDPSGKNSICLIVFSNRYTLSRSNDLAAFRITEPNTIKTFKSMFMAIVSQERLMPLAPVAEVTLASPASAEPDSESQTAIHRNHV